MSHAHRRIHKSEKQKELPRSTPLRVERGGKKKRVRANGDSHISFSAVFGIHGALRATIATMPLVSGEEIQTI